MRDLACVISLSLVAMALSLAPPAFAHHSFAAFDREQEQTISGTVQEWRWTNPHSWLFVVAPGPDGTADAVWPIETGSWTHMRHIGFTRTMMKPGDEVTVRLNPRKDGRPGGNLIAVTLPNGETKELDMQALARALGGAAGGGQGQGGQRQEEQPRANPP